MNNNNMMMIIDLIMILIIILMVINQNLLTFVMVFIWIIVNLTIVIVRPYCSELRDNNFVLVTLRLTLQRTHSTIQNCARSS